MKSSFEPATLTAARLKLETLKAKDLESVFLHYSDPLVAQHLGLTALESLEQAQVWLDRRLAQQLRAVAEFHDLQLLSFWTIGDTDAEDLVSGTRYPVTRVDPLA